MIKWLFALLFVISSAYALNCNGTYAGYSGSTDYTGIAYYNINQSCSANNNQSVPYMNAWVSPKQVNNLEDQSGNNRNLSTTGTVYYNNQNGFYSLNGSGNYLNGSNDSKYSVYGNNNLTTISIWAYINPDVAGEGSNGRQYIVAKGGSSNFEWQIHRSNDSFVIWQSFDLSGVTSDSFNILSGYNTTQWHNYMVVINGTHYQGYYDCRATSSTAITKLNGVGNAQIRIGSRASTQTFNGSVDDFRIYDVVLNSSEISQVCRNETVTRGLVAWHPFSNVSLTNGTLSSPSSTIRSCPVFVQPIDPLDDLSGSGNNISYQGTSNFWPVHNATTQGFESYGPITRRGLVTKVLASTPSLNLSNNSDFTYEIDFQYFKLPNQNVTGLIALSFRNGMDVNQAGTLRYGARNATDTSQVGLSSGVNVGLARHTAVLVYNASDENMTVYVNGTWKISTRITVDNFFSPSSGTEGMIRICDRSGILGSNSEDGNYTCYGAAIYNRGLSALEVMNNYQGNRVTNGLVGYYPFTNQTESGSCS